MQTNLGSDPLSLFAGLGIVLTLISLLGTRKTWIWGTLLGCSLAFAIFSHRIAALGLLWIGLLAGFSWLFFRRPLKPFYRLIAGIILTLFCLGFALHRLPGFQNWLLISDFYLSTDALPLRLYVNFDKPWIGVFLLLWGCPPLFPQRNWRSLTLLVAYLTAGACTFLLFTSLLLGYVRLDWKWFDFSALWLVINLFFVCFTEEAFFRLLIQESLSKTFSKHKNGRVLAWIAASVLFGLLHFAGGWKYVILATGAGLFYGYAYLVSRRVETSILIHFFVNAVHFLAFTYPALKGPYE